MEPANPANNLIEKIRTLLFLTFASIALTLFACEKCYIRSGYTDTYNLDGTPSGYTLDKEESFCGRQNDIQVVIDLYEDL